MRSMQRNINSLPNNIDELKSLLLSSFEEKENLKKQTEALIDQKEKLTEQISKKLTECDHWKTKYYQTLEQFKLAQMQRFAASTEKNPDQACLFNEPESPIEETEKEATSVAAHKRMNKPVRKPLPADLPREEIAHEVPEAQKQCECGCQKERFGEEVTEQLEIIPMQLKVIRHVRPKYVCKTCEGSISIAPMPNLLLPKSIAAPGLIADAITSKYVDHIPLYRQEMIWSRYGVSIPRNTSCGWLLKVAELCEPLLPLLKKDILATSYVQADETPLQVLNEPERLDQQKSYMWVYRGNDASRSIVLYDYQETRSSTHPKAFLSTYQGYLQTDGYKGYDWVNHTEGITHLGCMAHARRPFAKLVKLAKKVGKSHQALALITKLYQIEAKARDDNLSPEARHDLRLAQSQPILEKIKAWLDKSTHTCAPASTLGKAVSYMLDRWDELTNYLKDGRLEIDNNWIENNIRPFAIGKKNWLFAASPRGANASALFYSLIITCKANGIEPFAYFNCMLNRIRDCKTQEDYEALLPYNIEQLKTMG